MPKAGVPAELRAGAEEVLCSAAAVHLLPSLALHRLQSQRRAWGGEVASGQGDLGGCLWVGDRYQPVGCGPSVAPDSALMQIIRALEQATLPGPSHVTIGGFDGVHRGHQYLIGRMVGAAREAGRLAVALTFDPHPGAVLGRSPAAALSTVEERAALLDRLGVDLLAVLPFTPALAGTSAARFVDLLRRRLGMIELWAGPDFALGHRREGNIAYLQRLGAEQGFAVQVVEPLRWGGEVVSSTRIRAALTAGDVAEANGCLGRPYHLSGVVVRGRGLGCSLGIPTANLEPPAGRLIPANGVYACLAHTERSGTWPAVVNVGVRPTIAADHLTVEAHLLDFEGDLYGQPLGLDFLARLRDEEVFPSLNALVAQIRRDIAQARDIIRSEAITRTQAVSGRR